MKKFLSGALLALMLLGFSSFSEAQSEQENLCCGGNYGNYYCGADCDDENYCGRYGCGR